MVVRAILLLLLAGLSSPTAAQSRVTTSRESRGQIGLDRAGRASSAIAPEPRQRADVRKVTFSGFVLYQGAPVSEAKVTLRTVSATDNFDPDDKAIFTNTRFTDAKGRFAFEQVPVGLYEVTAEKRGLPTTKDTVNLGAGKAVDMLIQLGDVPEGNPSRAQPKQPPQRSRRGPSNGRTNPQPAPTAPSEQCVEEVPQIIEISEFAAKDENEMLRWLRKKGEESPRKRLVNILPTQDGSSLLFFARVDDDEEEIDYQVYAISGPLQPPDLLQRISLRSKNVFVGIYKIESSSFLMIYY